MDAPPIYFITEEELETDNVVYVTSETPEIPEDNYEQIEQNLHKYHEEHEREVEQRRQEQLRYQRQQEEELQQRMLQQYENLYGQEQDENQSLRLVKEIDENCPIHGTVKPTKQKVNRELNLRHMMANTSLRITNSEEMTENVINVTSRTERTILHVSQGVLRLQVNALPNPRKRRYSATDVGTNLPNKYPRSEDAECDAEVMRILGVSPDNSQNNIEDENNGEDGNESNSECTCTYTYVRETNDSDSLDSTKEGNNASTTQKYFPIYENITPVPEEEERINNTDTGTPTGRKLSKEQCRRRLFSVEEKNDDINENDDNNENDDSNESDDNNENDDNNKNDNNNKNDGDDEDDEIEIHDNGGDYYYVRVKTKKAKKNSEENVNNEENDNNEENVNNEQNDNNEQNANNEQNVNNEELVDISDANSNKNETSEQGNKHDFDEISLVSNMMYPNPFEENVNASSMSTSDSNSTDTSTSSEDSNCRSRNTTRGLPSIRSLVGNANYDPTERILTSSFSAIRINDEFSIKPIDDYAEFEKEGMSNITTGSSTPSNVEKFIF